MLQQFSPSAGRPHDDLDKYMDILLKVFKMFTKVNTTSAVILKYSFMALSGRTLLDITGGIYFRRLKMNLFKLWEDKNS